MGNLEAESQHRRFDLISSGGELLSVVDKVLGDMEVGQSQDKTASIHAAQGSQSGDQMIQATIVERSNGIETFLQLVHGNRTRKRRIDSTRSSPQGHIHRGTLERRAKLGQLQYPVGGVW